MDIEQFRRKIQKLTAGREVADYRYELECGHVAGGQTGMTHKQAQRRKTLICQECRQDDEIKRRDEAQANKGRVIPNSGEALR